jgi:hypothetical protein
MIKSGVAVFTPASAGMVRLEYELAEKAAVAPARKNARSAAILTKCSFFLPLI